MPAIENALARPFLLLLLGLPACADPPVGPGGGAAARLEVSVELGEGARLGEEAPVLVKAFARDGAPVSPPPGLQVRITDARPHFAGSEVAEVRKLDAGWGLRLLWPGAVEVRASAGALSAGTTVEVRPAQPVAGAVTPAHGLGPGDTATLAGYRLDLLAEGLPTAGGRPLEILERGSASLRFRVPESEADAGSACAPGARVQVDVGQATRFASGPWLVFGAALDATLEVGGYRFLQAPANGCLLFAGHGADSRYTLFYMDADPIRQSEDTYEDPAWGFGDLNLHLGEPGATYAAAAAPGPPAAAGSPPPHAARLTAADEGEVPEDHVRVLTRPLLQGERVHVDGDDGAGYDAARVVRVYEGRGGSIALLGLEAQGAEAAVGRAFGWDATMAYMADEGLALLATALSEAFPKNLRNGQVVILVKNSSQAVQMVTLYSTVNAPDDRPGGYILLMAPWLDLVSGTDPGLMPVAHEAAHTAQLARDHDLCVEAPERACAWGTAGSWSVEGNANFLAHEITRRSQGLAFDGNVRPAIRAWEQSGVITAWGPGHIWFWRGYAASEWFMRDLVQRAMQAGHPYDEALALVARAAHEPWYGWTEDIYFDEERLELVRGGRKRPVPGLVPRMRQVFGPAFDPVEALLLAGLSLAVDDRTEDPVLQNVTMGDAWEIYGGPFARLSLGGPEPRGVAATTRGYTFGWAEIDVPPEGALLAFGSEQPNVHWAVARTR